MSRRDLCLTGVSPSADAWFDTLGKLIGEPGDDGQHALLIPETLVFADIGDAFCSWIRVETTGRDSSIRREKEIANLMAILFLTNAGPLFGFAHGARPPSPATCFIAGFVAGVLVFSNRLGGPSLQEGRVRTAEPLLRVDIDEIATAGFAHHYLSRCPVKLHLGEWQVGLFRIAGSRQGNIYCTIF